MLLLKYSERYYLCRAPGESMHQPAMICTPGSSLVLSGWLEETQLWVFWLFFFFLHLAFESALSPWSLHPLSSPTECGSQAEGNSWAWASGSLCFVVLFDPDSCGMLSLSMPYARSPAHLPGSSVHVYVVTRGLSQFLRNRFGIVSWKSPGDWTT